MGRAANCKVCSHTIHRVVCVSVEGSGEGGRLHALERQRDNKTPPACPGSRVLFQGVDAVWCMCVRVNTCCGRQGQQGQQRGINPPR
jgi:hypothetical protein